MPLEWWVVLLFIFGGLIVLMATGIPVAFAFLFVNLIGVFVFWGGEVGLRLLILNIFSSVGSWSLVPIPMFVFMGEIMFQSGMGFKVIDVLDKWLGRLPGRLGLVTEGAATLFSTMSGSSMGTTAMLGSVLAPDMERRGYKKPMSIGPIMGSGGLAMIIPPSGFAVLLASICEMSIGKLLIAGIIPGLVIALFYTSYVILRCRFQPSIAPSYEVTPIPLSEKMRDTVRYVLPLGLIVFLVLGVIFLGIATPSEAAATGALGSFILAAIYQGLKWEWVKNAFLGTANIVVMILMIFAGAITFSTIVSFSGVGTALVKFVVSLPLTPVMILIAMQLILLTLGTFMCGVSMVMITMPLYMPIVYTLGIDPIWFGLLMLINVEMALTTPPFGMLLFVMKGVAPAGTTMGDIYRAGLPFLGCDALTIALVMVFPLLALWLPNMML